MGAAPVIRAPRGAGEERSAPHSRSKRTWSATAPSPENASQSPSQLRSRSENPRASLGATRASRSATNPPQLANADADAYGDPNSSGGLSGSTCHQRAPASASQSTNAYASRHRAPA